MEQPLPPQFDFVFRKWGEEIKADPSLAGQQPYKAIIERDMAFLGGVAVQDPEVVGSLLQAFTRSWAGTTPEEFDAQVREWLKTSRQPKLGVPYIELVYQPMLELLELLKAHQFRVFVTSGGGRDFMRAFAEDAWGIYKENVIGTAAEYTYADGRIVRAEGALGGLDVGPGKPEHIFAQTGRLPAFAGGNADVDIEMLESARFALLLNHDDDEREFAYTNGAEKSLAEAAGAGLDGRQHEKRLENRIHARNSYMSGLTAIDVLVDPDEATMERARAVNARMLASLPQGWALDDTHQPHITTLQRLRTEDLDQVYQAAAKTVAETDMAALSYRAVKIAHADWGFPGYGPAVLLVEVSPEVLDSRPG